jgi:RNA polymerase sigma factor (sigma-70 family)
MATGQLNQLLLHLRHAALLQGGAGMTDGQLLECFLNRRDTAALEALVRRHAAMAWAVCRRVLRNHHDAEDAFQATFLVLVRRAASIVPREMVANWLHGVAYRTALKARATAARRKGRERQVTDMPEPANRSQESEVRGRKSPTSEQDLRELQSVLDEELGRLPGHYRVVVVLCDLEGKTRKEAARQLGWPEGTVAGRLARARKLLAEALARRGVVLSAGALAVELAHQAASASAPAALVGSTIRAANLFAAGKVAAGAVSARVAALTEGMVRTMVLSKPKTIPVLFLIALLALGGGALGWPGGAAETGLPPQQAGPQPAGKKPADDNLKNTLVALDNQLWEAASRGDWQQIQKFYAAEYLGVESVNKSNKPANVEAVKTHRPADWKKRDVDLVRVGKDGAVLTYIYTCKVLSEGGTVLQTRQNHRATLVWAQRDGGWVLVFCHDEHGRPGSVSVLPTYYELRVKQFKTKPGPEPGK